jgi:hypothetical protein
MSATGTFTVDVTSKSVIKFELGAVAAVNSLPTYAAACAGGSMFKATVRNWKGTAAATDITAGNCVITTEADVTKNLGNSDTSSENEFYGAKSMTAALKFK